MDGDAKLVNTRWHIVAAPYAESAAELTSGVTGDAVRAALVELQDDGFFPGKPQLDETQF